MSNNNPVDLVMMETHMWCTVDTNLGLCVHCTQISSESSCSIQIELKLENYQFSFGLIGQQTDKDT